MEGGGWRPSRDLREAIRVLAPAREPPPCPTLRSLSALLPRILFPTLYSSGTNYAERLDREKRVEGFLFFSL